MDYFERLESETLKLYEIANEARSKGFDVELETEIPLAKDLAERVEGLVGPKGIAKRIKELEKDMSREEVAFEIAAEIASQLRLRNISGIIIIDFIDMSSSEDKEQLLAAMRSFVKTDPVKTEVIDLTRLGLMELTRKKTRRPLYEQLGMS